MQTGTTDQKEAMTTLDLISLVEETSPALTEILQECEINDKSRGEAQALVDFFKKQKNAYGLAANQVGISTRVFVLIAPYRKGEPVVCINPRIEKAVSRVKVPYHMFNNSRDRLALSSGEGCLSFPGKHSYIRRYDCIDVSYTTLDGTRVEERLRGFRAVAFQHELDHLNGIVCINNPDAYDPIGKAHE